MQYNKLFFKSINLRKLHTTLSHEPLHLNNRKQHCSTTENNKTPYSRKNKKNLTTVQHIISDYSIRHNFSSHIITIFFKFHDQTPYHINPQKEMLDHKKNQRKKKRSNTTSQIIRCHFDKIQKKLSLTHTDSR